MVRAWTASALDSRVGPAFWSTTTTGTPRRISTSPAIRPVGPAPTTRTSVPVVGRSAIRTAAMTLSFAAVGQSVVISILLDIWAHSRPEWTVSGLRTAAGVGVPQVPRRAGGDGVVAPGAVPGLRGRGGVLGAGRDRPAAAGRRGGG